MSVAKLYAATNLRMDLNFGRYIFFQCCFCFAFCFYDLAAIGKLICRRYHLSVAMDDEIDVRLEYAVEPSQKASSMSSTISICSQINVVSGFPRQ